MSAPKCFSNLNHFVVFVSNGWTLNNVVVVDVAAGYADSTKGEEKLHSPTKREKDCKIDRLQFTAKRKQ